MVALLRGGGELQKRVHRTLGPVATGLMGPRGQHPGVQAATRLARPTSCAGTLRAVAGNVLIMEQDRILREALTV
jgi:hypothetical protein